MIVDLGILPCPTEPSSLLLFIFPEEEEWEWWILLLLVPLILPVPPLAELLDV